MMTATMVVTASVMLLTGVLLGACQSDSDEGSGGPVPVAWGDVLEVGVLYEYDLYIHCGTWSLGKLTV